MFTYTNRANRARRPESTALSPTILSPCSPSKAGSVDRIVDAQQMSDKLFISKQGTRWELGAPVGAGNNGQFHVGSRIDPNGHKQIVGLKTAYDSSELAKEFEAMVISGSQLTSQLVKAGSVYLLETPVCDTTLASAAAQVHAAGVSNQALEAWAINVVGRVAKRIAIMHDSNMLHRDVKPDNVYVRVNNDVQLGDYGSARKEDAAVALSCSPGYWSASALNGTALTKADDVWMLGVMAMSLVMKGKTPFMLKDDLTQFDPNIDFPELGDQEFMSKMFSIMRESMNGYLVSRDRAAPLVRGVGWGRLEELRTWNESYAAELEAVAPRLKVVIDRMLLPKAADRPTMREVQQDMLSLQITAGVVGCEDAWTQIVREPSIQEGIDFHKAPAASSRTSAVAYQAGAAAAG